MARRCQLTGKQVAAGNNNTFSRKKSKRTFAPNLQNRTVILPTGEKIRVRVCTKYLKKQKGFFFT